MKRVYAAARGSIAKIESAGGLGAGFVFGSPRHVATALHVVDSGRPVRVSFEGEDPVLARVVAVDPEHDLAVLELPEPAGHFPLPAETSPLEVGDPLLAIGHPLGSAGALERRMRGLFTWSATVGILSARTDEYLQTDAALNPGNSGGPLLGCSGRVLGVVSLKLTSAEGVSLAVPVARLVALFASMGNQPEFTGSWSAHGSFGGVYQRQDGRTLLGFSLGLALVGRDRWSLRAQLGPLWSLAPSDESPLDQTRTTRLFAELTLGRRIMLGERLPFYLVPAIGAVALRDGIDHKTTSLTVPPCPGPAPCPAQAETELDRSHPVHLYPQAGASLLLGGLELGYAFQLDPHAADRSIHRVFLGFGD